jgi:hypothetical protein
LLLKPALMRCVLSRFLKPQMQANRARKAQAGSSWESRARAAILPLAWLRSLARGAGARAQAGAEAPAAWARSRPSAPPPLLLTSVLKPLQQDVRLGSPDGPRPPSRSYSSSAKVARMMRTCGRGHTIRGSECCRRCRHELPELTRSPSSPTAGEPTSTLPSSTRRSSPMS